MVSIYQDELNMVPQKGILKYNSMIRSIWNRSNYSHKRSLIGIRATNSQGASRNGISSLSIDFSHENLLLLVQLQLTRLIFLLCTPLRGLLSKGKSRSLYKTMIEQIQRCRVVITPTTLAYFVLTDCPTTTSSAKLEKHSHKKEVVKYNWRILKWLPYLITKYLIGDLFL